VFSTSAGLDAVAKLASVGIELPLADVYPGIVFPADVPAEVEAPANGEAASGRMPDAASDTGKVLRMRCPAAPTRT
jgi:hypothetical protein